MGPYLGMRITAGAYTYDYIISKKPELKDDIDTYLTEKGRADLISNVE